MYLVESRLGGAVLHIQELLVAFGTDTQNTVHGTTTSMECDPLDDSNTYFDSKAITAISIVAG